MLVGKKTKKLLSTLIIFSTVFTNVSIGKYVVRHVSAKDVSLLNGSNDGQNMKTETFKGCKVQENLRKTIEGILPDVVKFAQKESFSSDWVNAGLANLDNYKNEINPNYLKDVKDQVKKLKEQQDKGESTFKVTDLERITIGVVSSGGDPTNIDGINIIERIYNPRKNERGQDYIVRQGLNAAIWALIAIDTKNYSLPKDATWNRDKLIKEILDNECSNENHKILKGQKGGWQFGGNSNIDPDITGMAMIALAPYYNTREDVKEAVDRAVNNLSLIQGQDGGYASWGTVNSESCVQVIMGLCANNISPFSDKFTKKGGNVVDALLRFKVEGTGFAHALDPSDNKLHANGMANEQALYGLAQIIYSLDGNKGSIFKCTNNKTDVEDKIEDNIENKIEVKRIGEGSLKRGASAEVKFSIINNCNKNRDVALAVVLYDKKTNEMINYSYVKKTLNSKEEEKFAAGFIIPEKGEYEVKALICDDLNKTNMNMLAKPVNIEVE